MLELCLYLLLLIIGVGLIAFKPLTKMTGLSQAWEAALGTAAILAFGYFMTETYLMTPAMEAELMKQPCGSESPQGVCYSLEKNLCESAWKNAEESCKAELSAVHRERPTALIGPTLNRCKARRMDQTLHFNRRAATTPYCRAYFDYINGPPGSSPSN